MKKGQNCKVRWDSPNKPGEYIWHNAMIKSIEGDTITVIWEEGGSEADRIPLDWVIVRDDITSVREDVKEVKDHLLHLRGEKEEFIKLFLSKLDGVTTRLDILNSNLQRHWETQNILDRDIVNFDVNQMRASLNSLGSVHMYSRTTSPNEEEQVRRYTSAPVLPVFDNYKKNKD
jgi:hypothetical protein